MTSNTQTKDQKGYDHKFVDPVPNELLCLICLLAARDSQQTTCCGKVYCETCVNELKKHSSKCPGCRGDINCFPDKRSDRNVKEMKTKCDNADNGCEWIDELHLLDKHLIACDYTFLSCPNECHDGDRVLRKDLEKHKTEECPRRQYTCPHCEESGEYEERTIIHLEECPYVRIPCSNDGCCELVARCDISFHSDECEFEMVPCKYGGIGCKVKVLRKDLRKHKEDRQQHLEFAIDAVPKLDTTLKRIRYFDLPSLERQLAEQYGTVLSVQDDVSRIDDEQIDLQEIVKQQGNILTHLQSIILAQSKEISELKSKLEKQTQITSSTAPAPWNRYESYTQPTTSPDLEPIFNQISLNVFKLTNFAERKSCNASVFSPPFYSSPGGYKLCIKVYTNGCGDSGKGTHVSVFTYLMRGDNDDHLPWPFTGTVEMELLNQLNDNWHHSMMSTEFRKSDSARGKRILDDDKAKIGYGHKKYISHSALGYMASLNRQFLKDDCLYFRIKVNCARKFHSEAMDLLR